jgi:hypothetical protein
MTGNGRRKRLPHVIFLAAFVINSLATAREHKLASGEAANDAISIVATVYDAEQMKEAVGTGFEQDYIVLDLKLHPKTPAPYDIKLDDFILRNENSGEHSGPLAAGQIAGSGMLIVKTDGSVNQRKGGFSVGMGGMMGGPAGNGGAGETRSVEMKDDTPGGSQLDVLKKKILAEKPVTTDTGGLLFFPMNAKEKPKNLNLQVNTPAGVLRIKFK